MKVKNNIILALDVMDIDEAITICDKVKGQIDTIKIGYPLTLAVGIECINILKEQFNFQVICDYKVADIDATNDKIADITYSNGADGLICHGFVGEDSIRSCLDKANEYNRELFLLTEMSHPGARKFLQPVAEDIAQLGVDLNIKNYVAPATRPNRLKTIRNIVGKDAYIISPGVGTQGGSAKETLKISDAIIVGRSIYTSDNPEKAVKDILTK
ncbi:orotidine-5'-phosphate decarboxylase [uncultured Methanobrevibacter sp.]|uniref:orotidine-5'-phosphate decarboxylase n=1 Tax=uncultured Methanobrevibacter sp. TaxID=253161 RepID=UPI0025DFD780|nr:orotidine-5'-phosphate decarboxylase [uncultured Methanobrevibacter sp.]